MAVFLGPTRLEASNGARRHDLKAVVLWPDEDGLEDTLALIEHELLDVSEFAPGLVGVGVDLLRKPADAGRRRGRYQVDKWSCASW